MNNFILTTFDWVPELPRGFVRDIRIRWALEEAKMPYKINSVSFYERGDDHFSHQPFGQVPWLTDGDISIFESGAILFYLGERSRVLLPTDPKQRNEVIEWLFAALNSVEMASLPWALLRFSNAQRDTPAHKQFDAFLQSRLQHMESFLAEREWLAQSFSIADIVMADVLRLVNKFDRLTEFPHCLSYVQRATVRPSFQKAYADQMAHFAAADAKKNA